MAAFEFDFSAFKEQKFAEYKKKDIKPVIVRKSKAGIVFVDYKMAGKKTPCVFIPLKKVPMGIALFKKIKASKEHILKKTALVDVAIDKNDIGEDRITLTIKKGGLSREMLIQKGNVLFETVIKMQLVVEGGVEESEESEESVDLNDVDALESSAAYIKMITAFKNFQQKQYTDFKNEKNATTIKALIESGKKLLQYADKVFDQFQENEKESVEKIQLKIRSIITKVKDAIANKKGSNEQAGSSDDDIQKEFDGLKTMINELLSSFSDEIDQIPTLKAALQAMT